MDQLVQTRGAIHCPLLDLSADSRSRFQSKIRLKVKYNANEASLTLWFPFRHGRMHRIGQSLPRSRYDMREYRRCVRVYENLDESASGQDGIRSRGERATQFGLCRGIQTGKQFRSNGVHRHRRVQRAVACLRDWRALRQRDR